MKRILPSLTRVGLALLVLAWLLATPVSAQETKPGPAGGGGETKAAPPSGGSSGSSAPAGNTGGQPSGFGGGFSRGEDGRRGGSTGGSGMAMPREHAGAGGGSGSAPRGSGSGPEYKGGSAGSGGGPSNGPSVERGKVRGDGGGKTNGTTGSGADGVPAYARPRDGKEPVGTAVPRGSVPMAPRDGGTFIPGGYYGGYGYYDPFGYGYGYGNGYGYGGYYGGFYDPWYGGYPTYPQSSYTSGDEGSLRLKIKPSQGEVYVDGYYVGVVDDFDGIFQRLHLDSGVHRIEVRAPGYETLSFDVRISPDHTTTYQGELKKIQ